MARNAMAASITIGIGGFSTWPAAAHASLPST
jgi:hypothetical protein